MESKRFTVNKEDLKSLAITIGLTAISAGVAKAVELIPTLDMGGTNEALLITTATLAILKFVQKLLSGK